METVLCGSGGEGGGKLWQEWAGVGPAVQWESLQDFTSLRFRATERMTDIPSIYIRPDSFVPA